MKERKNNFEQKLYREPPTDRQIRMEWYERFLDSVDAGRLMQLENKLERYTENPKPSNRMMSREEAELDWYRAKYEVRRRIWWFTTEESFKRMSDVEYELSDEKINELVGLIVRDLRALRDAKRRLSEIDKQE